ncbi:MAG: Astacin, partial [Pseudomonadota bacterium]
MGCAHATLGYYADDRNVLTMLPDSDPCISRDPRFPSVVIHEMAHAMGMGHEFSRQDRDYYIGFNASNMRLFLSPDIPENERVPEDYLYGDDVIDGFFPKTYCSILKDTDDTSCIRGKFDYYSVVMYDPFLFKLSIQKHLPVLYRRENSK